MMLTRGNTYQYTAQGEQVFDKWPVNEGRAGGKGQQKGRNQPVDYLSQNHRERMRAISKTM